MTANPQSTSRPLVVALCSVPLLHEGLEVALGEIADVRVFPANGNDTVGLLRMLRPDAIVVDDADQAETAAAYAGEASSTLLHISLKERRLRILRRGGWEDAGNGSTSPEELRNIVIASMLARGEGS